MGDAGLRQRGAAAPKVLKVLPGRSATGPTSEHAEPQGVEAEAERLLNAAEAKHDELTKVRAPSPSREPQMSALASALAAKSNEELTW